MDPILGQSLPLLIHPLVRHSQGSVHFFHFLLASSLESGVCFRSCTTRWQWFPLHVSALAQFSLVHKPFQMELALEGDFWHFPLKLFQGTKPTGTTWQDLSSHSEVTAGIGDAIRLNCTKT